MTYTILFHKMALKDIDKIIKSGNKIDILKLDSILEELKLHPKHGIGNPELLKYNLAGFWSRRINRKDRIIYEIIEEPERLVVIISALGHY